MTLLLSSVRAVLQRYLLSMFQNDLAEMPHIHLFILTHSAHVSWAQSLPSRVIQFRDRWQAVSKMIP